MYPSPNQGAQSSFYDASAQAANAERRALIVDLFAYPGRSVRSLCLPGLRTFGREMLNARWGVVWLSLFALPLLSSLTGLLLGIASHHSTSGMIGGILLGPLVVIPLLFFIVQGLIWPLSRYFQGGGTFLEQCYTTFLSLAPFFFLGSVITILLVIDSTSRIGAILTLLELLLLIYTSILLVVALKAVHGVTTWEAIALSILPLFSILAVMVVILIALLFVASQNSDSNGGSNSNGKSGSKDSNQDVSTPAYQQQPRYYRAYPWWWWGPRYERRDTYVNTGTNQKPGAKQQWLCPTCSYRCWLRGPAQEVKCIRCDAPMQVTEATR